MVQVLQISPKCQIKEFEVAVVNSQNRVASRLHHSEDLVSGLKFRKKDGLQLFMAIGIAIVFETGDW